MATGGECLPVRLSYLVIKFVSDCMWLNECYHGSY